MANTLRPWIVKYLSGVVEKYGDQIYNVPEDRKPRTIQLVQFLTYPSETQSSFVWAIASDKSHKLPIRLSADAMKEYQARRLTQHKTVIISIKCYKPIFCRVPIANQGMSKNASLALECQGFSVLGSYGEACFGDPNSINDIKDLKLWSERLTQDVDGSCANGKAKTISEPVDFKSIYKSYDQLHPRDEDLSIFETLPVCTRQGSPERVVSDWEVTPVKLSRSRWLNWREVHQILLWTGRSRRRGKR